MKRWIVLVLVLAMAASAFAGGQKEAPGMPAGKRTIVLRGQWMENERKDVMKALAAAFESKNPSVTFDVEETMPEKLLATLAAKQPVDLIWANDIDVGPFADRNMVVDLGAQYMGREGGLESWKQKMSPAPWEPLMWKGKGPFMAVTYWLVALGWMNMDILKDNGLALPKMGWTPADLMAMSEKVSKDTNGDGQNDFFGLEGEQANISTGFWVFLPKVWGSETFLPVGNKPSSINNPRALEALTWLAEMGKKGLAAPKSLVMESGKTLYTAEGPYRIVQYQNINLDCEPVAPLTMRETATKGYSGGFFIVKSNREQEDLCWQFIKVASEPQWQIEFARQTGFGPLDSGFNSSEGSAFLASVNEKTRRQWGIFREYGKYGTAGYPNVPNVWSITGDIVDPLIEAVVAGRMDPAAALERMQREINQAAAPYLN